MKKLQNINLPVSYSVAQFDSERFLKLRIKVMHTGLNLNNSNFDSSAVEAAAHTLSNIPLLAFVKRADGEDKDDFAGHEYEIKITEDDMKFVYLGRPIGIVPESNNYAVETDEEGRTFVCVDAYVWKDYANSALDILSQDEVKKISMEIIVDDYESTDSYINIKAYKYTGIVLLGEDVKEAMIGAKATVVEFSADSITAMMSELKDAMTKAFKVENASNLKTPDISPRPQIKKEQPVVKEEVSEQEQTPNSETEGVDLKSEEHVPTEPEEPTVEPPALPDEQIPSEPTEDTVVDEPTEEIIVDEVVESEKVEEEASDLDDSDATDEEYTIKELPNKKPLKTSMPQPQGATNVDTSEDDDEDDLHAQKKAEDDDEPVDDGGDDSGDPENNDNDGDDEPEPEEFAKLNKIIEDLKKENAELKEYQTKVLQQAFEENKALLFAEFPDLESEDFEALEKMDLSLEDMELHLYAIRGKKVRVEKTTKLGIIDTSTQFTKKVKAEPEYADLIRQHTQR